MIQNRPTTQIMNIQTKMSVRFFASAIKGAAKAAKKNTSPGG